MVADTKCPLNLFHQYAIEGHHKRTDLMNYSPGEILFSGVRTRNETHLVIQTTIQFLAFISQPTKSKFLLSLRNPSDR